jgi:hypothetical protein
MAKIEFETAHEIGSIVANPPQEGSGWIPGIKEYILGAATQAIVGIAE